MTATIDELREELGPAVWGLMGRETPYMLSPQGKIHCDHCQHRNGRDLLDLAELVYALRTGARPARCCGASPVGWVHYRAQSFTAAETLLEGVSR